MLYARPFGTDLELIEDDDDIIPAPCPPTISRRYPIH